MFKVSALRIIFVALAFIALQANAQDDRNLVVKRVNAASEQRIALVIGNGAYINSPLKNPVNDAKDMAKKLRGLGFDVVERSNLQIRQIGGTLREFRSKLVPGAVALVFYAGHGLQIKGFNYLPAVDADINSEEDVPNQSLGVNQIMDVLDEAKTRLNLVFLDACRNNPYASSFRSADKGLARVTAPSGTLISYATKPGSVAADGNGRNGLYTSKLLAQMDSPLQIEQVLKRVVTEVKAASQGKQEPWMEGSIEGDFCFVGCAANGGSQVESLAPLPAATHAKSKEEIEDDTWKAAEEANIPDSYKTYLSAYSNGRYAAQAKIKLATLKNPTENLLQASTLEGDIPEMVRIPGRNYELGKFDVTQKEWREVMGSNPSKFQSCGETCPVEQVSWDEIQAFLQKLNAKTGRQYRLPTEAEWEYACYGGNQTEYCGGNDIDAVAWYGNNSQPGGNSGQSTHPVGQKLANGYGLYDMSGNVWQWMENKYDNEHDWRALRGGSWINDPRLVRAAYRGGRGPTFRSNIGFRVARTLP